MRAVMGLDHLQLSRIDDAMSRIMSSPPAARQRASYLMVALEKEKAEIMQARSGKRPPRTTFHA